MTAVREAKARTRDAGVLLLADDFEDTRPPGAVIGTLAGGGAKRLCVDIEARIGIDHGALRIEPLMRAGWGRSGIAYGPFRREPGLAFAVLLLNGHNASRWGGIEERFARRLGVWLLGGRTDPAWRRAFAWLRAGDKRRTAWLFRWWLARTRAPRLDTTLDNLAVGWFTTPAPQHPGDGHALVERGGGHAGGELRGRVHGHLEAAAEDLQNVPLLAAVVLRERGALYYLAIAPSEGEAVLRLVMLDDQDDAAALYPGVHQAVSGEIGFSHDTRVYAARVARLPNASRWYGAAHAADRLDGLGAIDGTASEGGDRWRVLESAVDRGPHGAFPASDGRAMAVLDPGAPTGLVHAEVEVGASTGAAGLCWRVADGLNYWGCELSGTDARVYLVRGGSEHEVALDMSLAARPGEAHSLQVVDDGRHIGVLVDGRLLGGGRFQDTRLAEATGVGIVARPGDGTPALVRSFEAHPRAIALPPVLDLRMRTSLVRQGVTRLEDPLCGTPCPLEGRHAGSALERWKRTLGRGRLCVTGQGARVEASPERPNPGRTAYTLPWAGAEADVSVEIVPPGSGRGMGEGSRAGLIFWQDADNYLIVSEWLDDAFEGASLSCFYRRHGWEELYRAVWTNVGDRIAHGRPNVLRVAFDGMRYRAHLDGEPVIERKLTDIDPRAERLAIARVGIVVNWEWGDDTGSLVRNFVARG